MRNYSHFIVKGEWIVLSKAQKVKIAETLFSNPDVAVIAATGQKHIIFRARPGHWQFEEQTIVPDRIRLVACLSPIQGLYDGGFSKGQIQSGRYDQRSIMEFGPGEWHRVETRLRSLRGTKIFSLALFLAQKGAQDGDADA
jgi:hypothetical protein